MGLKYNQIQLWGLFVSCPINANHEKCPFKEIRKKSLKEGIEKLLILSDEEIDMLLNYCNNCLYFHELGDLEAIEDLDRTKIKNV